MLEGEIQFVVADKGFGFIKPANNGDDVFFHSSAVNVPFETLAPGQSIKYELDSESEKPRALSVQVLAGSDARAPRARNRNASTRPASNARPSRGHASRSSRQLPRSSQANWKQGFVTKLHRKTYSGFISSVEHGPEFLFAAESVSGEKPYSRLSIGDYVQFIVGEPNPEDPRQPVAKDVQAIEREVKDGGNQQLARHPKARKKKPSWR